VFDFLIGLAFVVMVVGPAILASMQRAKTHDTDGASDTGASDSKELVASTVNAGDAAVISAHDGKKSSEKS
jgi:hypothetical protein